MKSLTAVVAIAALAATATVIATAPAPAAPNGVTMTVAGTSKSIKPTIANTTGKTVDCFLIGQKSGETSTSVPREFELAYPNGIPYVYPGSWTSEFTNLEEGDYLVYWECVNDVPEFTRDQWTAAVATAQAVPVTVKPDSIFGSLDTSFAS